jgi:hypothetical protein
MQDDFLTLVAGRPHEWHGNTWLEEWEWHFGLPTHSDPATGSTIRSAILGRASVEVIR